MTHRAGTSSPDYEPPVVASPYRLRRLVWVGLKLAVLVTAWQLFATTDDQDYDRLAWVFYGTLIGLPLFIMGSLRWIRPRLHACPNCRAPAPSPGRESFDINALAGEMSGLPRSVRNQVLMAGSLVHWAKVPVYWLLDGVVQSAVACPSCHAWFRAPAADEDEPGSEAP